MAEMLWLGEKERDIYYWERKREIYITGRDWPGSDGQEEEEAWVAGQRLRRERRLGWICSQSRVQKYDNITVWTCVEGTEPD
jgi:hypothetical protein